MVSTLLTTTNSSITGTNGSLTLATGWGTAAAGGNHYANTGDEIVVIKNNGTDVDVKVITQVACDYGGLHTEHDVSFTVGAGTMTIAGRYAPGRFNDASGYTYITYPGGSTAGVYILILKVI